MCGIFASFGRPQQSLATATALASLQHRGPDEYSSITFGDGLNTLAHSRLCIFAIKGGHQPISHRDIMLIANAEIYNHQEIKDDPVHQGEEYSPSDCSAIIATYEHGIKTGTLTEAVARLDGFFAFVLYDGNQDMVFAARDPIGITSLYYAISSTDDDLHTVAFASTATALMHIEGATINVFPPGHYYYHEPAAGSTSVSSRFTRYTLPLESYTPQLDMTDPHTRVRQVLIKAVEKRLMTEAPFGVLLSGGLDSSLIAAICSRVRPDKQNALATFSIGLEGAPDHVAAIEVARHIGSNHTAFEFTVDEAIRAFSEVIGHLETFDVTTIRASTPMYLLAQKIKQKGYKMVLSGEGSDELLAGYVENLSAPSVEAMHQNSIERINNLHMFDCLRANKSTMAHGLEARVPFLDKHFVELVFKLPIQMRSPLVGPDGKIIEKHLLRSAFKEGNWLPDSILWRRKEQFSGTSTEIGYVDGVGYSWIDRIKCFADDSVSDESFEARSTCYPTKTPQTKEAYLYRWMFEQQFGSREDLVDTVKQWVPHQGWGLSSDPSGRAQKTHSAYAGV